MQFRLPVLILSLLVAASARADIDCNLLVSVQRTSVHLAENQFEIRRDFGEYRQAFGLTFTELLSHLQKQDVWIDFGAGEAIAQLGYLERFDGRAAKTIAVGFKRPELSDPSFRKTQILSETSGQFQYLEGDILAPTLNLPMFMAGTDLYGPASYTHLLSQVLNRYFSRMVPNHSHLFLLLDYNRNSIILKNGTRISIGEWLSRFPELKVERFDFSNRGDERLEIILLDENFVLPELELVSFKSHKPPHRLFRVK